MSKEIYISTTPHETRLAIVEDEQLAEIYFERENEYTLAGSIYNGKVTRVLPGMQSSFVDVGLERDAFLYVTDFMEEQGDAADFETEGGSRRQPPPARDETNAAPARDRGDRHTARRNERPERKNSQQANTQVPAESASTSSFDEPIAPPSTEPVRGLDTEQEGDGSRRWRGRRGRRRGRGLREEQPASATGQAEAADLEIETDTADFEVGFVEGLDASADDAGTAIEVDAVAEPETQRPQRDDRSGKRGRDRSKNRDRAPRRDEPRAAPAFDNSYAGYMSESFVPDASAEPILLPGESIRKYRDPAEVAAEDAEAKRTAPQQTEAMVVGAPSINVAGWDGGAVLPGETLRRRGRDERPSRTGTQRNAVAPQPAATQRDSSRDVQHVSEAVLAEPEGTLTNPPDGEPGGTATVETIQRAALPDVPVAAVPDVPVAVTDTPDAAMPVVSVVDSTQPENVADATSAFPEASAEYEPQEGAGASVGDTGRRNLLRMERPTEPSVEARQAEARQAEIDEPAQELAGTAPDPTTYDLNGSADDAAETQTFEGGYAEKFEPLVSEITDLTAEGEMVSFAEDTQPVVADLHPQDELEPEMAARHEDVTHVGTTPELNLPVETAVDGEIPAVSDAGPHAYGDGDFHEEELDGEFDAEENEFPLVLAHVEEGEMEYEEETLEGSADPGSVFHDMSQDAHEADDEDEPELVLGDAGGFTEEDFIGRSAAAEEDEPSPGTATASPERLPRRDRHADGRDRRGGHSSGDRGRGGRRQSMQTTDLPAINELLKPGQEILVQIAKEPIAKKGARITSHIALPGRFLVFMPTVNHTGVSRKISSDEERRRLKSILLSEKGDAQGGFIVRTAADGASEEELRNDLRFLIQMWTDIKLRSESSKSPALIYHDLNLVERILRDQVTDNFSAIWVDTEQEYERVLRFLQRFQPSLVRRVKLYTKETPLFEHFGVTAEIDKALKSKVWLKSGGSIVINQTEALVAIDINTGKYVGKTARLEDTILKTNLDAIPEIVRQIRLRDLGGIIVIDFIDMDERKNRAKVMQVLEDAMRVDRAPSKILPFNDFGLVIMTRKRVKQSLERTLCMPDPITEGTGMIKSPITIANEIYVEMRKMHRHLEKTDVMLRVHPEVVKTLKSNGGKRLQELEDMTRKTILVKSDPSLSPEAFDIH